MTTEKTKLYVQWMHCKACTVLIRDTALEIDGIQDVHVHLNHQTIEITKDPAMTNEITKEEFADMLNPVLKWYGYSVHTDQPIQSVNRWEYLLAVVLAWALIYGFLEIQSLWLLQMLNAGERTLGTSFVIGLIASVSSCLAVVGAVVLGLWTVYAKSSSFRPHTLFHVGRLVGFFVLWGLLWAIWSAFQLSPTVSIMLNMIIAVVLFILWLNLLWITNRGVTFGWWIFQRFKGRGNDIVWPLLIGIGTFFLPCGFTQSMQVYSLSTGSFLSGWLTMLSFALGTLPMLWLLSITGKSIQTSSSAGLFFKTIGVLLVVLALYNIISSLVALGIIAPLFSL